MTHTTGGLRRATWGWTRGLRASLAALVTLLGAALSSQQVAAQSAAPDFKAGPPSGKYSFSSSTPRTLAELFNPPQGGSAVNVVGHWFLPAGDAKVPAVILMHGSGGIYDAMLDFWPKTFNAAGIAVLSVDSFGPRGVSNTVEDQSQVPFAADTADAYAALRLLASHPRVDPARIALMGFSRGGITTWRANLAKVVQGQGVSPGFAAYVPLYSGGCSGSLRVAVKPGVFSPAPMLWVHGADDDYTPIGPCKDLAERIDKAGTPSEFVTIAGAHHKFDMDEQRRVSVRGAQRSMDTCPLEFDVQSLRWTDSSTGQQLGPQEAQALHRSKCAATGATVWGNLRARDEAAVAIKAFFKKTIAQ